jgi:Fe-S-cluster containining protein
VKRIDPLALEPAPSPEFCDQQGVFYVAGYALRCRDDEAGSCFFLKEGRCTIYQDRMSICRIYPYMLHREPDDNGKIDWRLISGLGLHGECDKPVSLEEAESIAHEVKEYEIAFLVHEIRYFRYIQDFFNRNGLRHVQKIYDEEMRRFRKGEPIVVRVFHSGAFDELIIRP